MQLSPTIERVILSALITLLASIPLTQSEVDPGNESHFLTAHHTGTLSLPWLKF